MNTLVLAISRETSISQDQGAAIYSQEIHIHLPNHLEGPVHVYVHDSAETTPLPLSDKAVATSSPDVELMLRRFEDFDPTTNARHFHDHLVGRNWQPLVPQSKNGKIGTPYIRFIYAGRQRKAVLYINTKAVVSIGTKEHDFVGKLPGADVHHSTETYFYYGEGQLQEALDAAEALEAWADGQAI